MTTQTDATMTHLRAILRTLRDQEQRIRRNRGEARRDAFRGRSSPPDTTNIDRRAEADLNRNLKEQECIRLALRTVNRMGPSVEGSTEDAA